MRFGVSSYGSYCARQPTQMHLKSFLSHVALVMGSRLLFGRNTISYVMLFSGNTQIWEIWSSPNSWIRHKITLQYCTSMQTFDTNHTKTFIKIIIGHYINLYINIHIHLVVKIAFFAAIDFSPFLFLLYSS